MWVVVMTIPRPLRLDQLDHEEELPTVEPTESSHPEVITMPSRFEKSQNTGFIDVWWLYDDGGECHAPFVFDHTPFVYDDPTPCRSGHSTPLLAVS